MGRKGKNPAGPGKTTGPEHKGRKGGGRLVETASYPKKKKESGRMSVLDRNKRCD